MAAGVVEAVVAWWRSLTSAPEPLTSRQRIFLITASVVTAMSRWLALARSPWDWDEVLFELAMQRYDVAQHRPHPPGFPLFILAADAIHAVTGASAFHSLQALNFLAAIAIVPATFFLCRELRMHFTSSLMAALLLAFAPNVWFFGGGAFSDVPSMTLVVLGIALLLRGCRHNASLFAGAFVIGIAAGFRPQNLLVAFAPFLIVATHQRRRSIAAGAIIVAIVALSFGGAAAVTGFSTYRAALAKHQQYITAIDSFRSPTRPSLWRVSDDFFVRPYRAWPINIAVTLLVAVALIRLRGPSVVALATFGPFLLFAWLFLDYHSTSRFSIGYAPLFAILAAEGIARLRPIVGVVLLVLMIAWTLPSLVVVHATDSPPIAAIEWVRTHVDPRCEIALIDAELVPYAERALDGFETRYVSGRGYTFGAAYRGLVREGRGEIDFHRERERLAGIARDRYFDVSITPLHDNISFRERSATRVVAVLPPLKQGTLELSLTAPESVTISLDGRVLERIQASGDVTRRYMVDGGELVITSSRPGLMLRSMGWLPEVR